jgi:hypothetical protein
MSPPSSVPINLEHNGAMKRPCRWKAPTVMLPSPRVIRMRMGSLPSQHHVGESHRADRRLSVTYRPLAAAAAPQEFTA